MRRTRLPSYPGVLLAGLLLVPLLAAGAALPQASAGPATFDPCDVSGVERVVAVGDVHGAYEQFTAILRAARVIDERGHWAGGRTHFVQVGDLVDRGPASRQVLDLMMRLEREAPAAGGRVYPLLGNHEVLAMVGDVRYASAAEFDEFRHADSEAVREVYYDRVLADWRAQASREGRPFDDAMFREAFLRETPLGLVERQVAFGPEGEYGRWLRQRDAVARINRVVFVHGGISSAVAELGCRSVNQRVRAELTTGFEEMAASPETSLVAGDAGPLWYRGLAQMDETAGAPIIDGVLSRLDATAVVAGHTVVPGGRIQVRFGGRLFQIDTGMLVTVFAGGRPSALEITGGVFTAIYSDSRDRLFPVKTPD